MPVTIDEPFLQTIQQLADWMRENCFNFSGYSVGGNVISEGFILEKVGDQFVWSYTERGQKTLQHYFQTEVDIVAFAYRQIKADMWAKTYCVSFVTDQRETVDVAAQLRELAIDYWQDEIPHFYGTDRPAYRTFVFGCDIRRVRQLEKRYNKLGK